MIQIDLLKNHPNCLPRLSKIWHELLGKTQVPEVPIERVVERDIACKVQVVGIGERDTVLMVVPGSVVEQGIPVRVRQVNAA